MAPVDRKKIKNAKKTSLLTNNNKIKKKQKLKKVPRKSKLAQFKECLTCPKCKQLLVGVNAIRVRPCSKLSMHMQKLLRKRKESEESLTDRQHQLLNKAMQRCGQLVLKCVPCKWQAKVKLQTREALHKHRAQLRERSERERQEQEGEREESTVTLDKKALQKLKKKERRKKSAEAKMQDQQMIKRSITSTPVHNATEGKSETPTGPPCLPSPAVTPLSQTFSSGTTPSKPGMSVSGITATPQQGINTPHNLNTSGIAASQQQVKQTPIKSNTSSITASPHQVRKSPHNFKAVSQPGNMRTTDSPRSLSGVQRGKVQKLGKQQLKRMLNQKTPAKLTASESLSQFLDCLK